MAGLRPLTLIDGEIKELPLDQALAPLPVLGTTLQHANGVVTVDPSVFNLSQFVADTYVPAQVSFQGQIGHNNTTGTPLILPGNPQTGDTIAVIMLGPYGVALPITGYTRHWHASRGVGVYTKVMGAVPDNSITLPTNLSSGGALVVLLRGVDHSNPLDIPVVQNNNFSLNVAVPDLPAVTTATDGAMVWSFAVHRNSASFRYQSTPPGFIKRHGSTINTTPSVSFSKEITTAGYVDPGTYGSAIDYWSTFTTAWRPGAASGEKDYTVQFANPPAGNLLYQGRLMLVVQATGGSFTFPGAQWMNTPPDFSVPGTHLIDYLLNAQGAYLTRVN